MTREGSHRPKRTGAGGTGTGTGTATVVLLNGQCHTAFQMFVYTQRLVLLSTLVREALVCSEQWLIQRLRTLQCARMSNCGERAQP